ncbi:MAG: HYR domain-containing protein [bacterium]
MIMLITFIGSSLVFADGFTVDTQRCVDAGGTVVFTISVTNAPKAVSSFGFEINFDPSVLEYVSFKPGDALAGFGFCQYNKISPNTVKVGGLDPYGTGGLAAGASGKVGEITFKVLQCGSSPVSVVKLADDMADWPAQAGALQPDVQHAPVLQTIGNQNVMVDSTLSFTAQATDEDGDTITYSILNAPDGASFDSQTGQFNWTPGQAQANQSYTVVITATDGTGRSDDETITITVQEPSAPVLQPIGNKTVSAGDTLSFTALATDADGDAITYAASNAPAGATFDSLTGQFTWIPTQAEAGQTYSVVITATDTTGRSASETVSITVTSATLSLNSQSCTGMVGEEVTFTISVNGATNKVNNFGLEVGFDENILEFKPSTDEITRGTLTHDFDFFGVSHPRANTLKVAGAGRTGFDQASSGSLVNLVFVVKSCGPATVSIIRDRLDDDMIGWSVADGQLVEAPSIVCPSSIVVEADSIGGASISNPQIQAFLNGATATDALNNLLPVTTNAPAMFGLGITEVTFMTVNGAGTVNSCKATVTVQDTMGPAINCPGDITVEATGPDGIPASALQSFLNSAVATDVVEGSLNVTSNAPAVFPLGATVVTFSAQDSGGYVSSCSATVNVMDNTPPSISCPGTVLRLEAEDSFGVPADRSAIISFFGDVAATDAGDASVTITNDAPAQFPIGTTQVTFTAQDDYGNTDSCAATVIVEDTTAPLINCPGNITVEAATPGGVDISNAQIQSFLNGATASDSASAVSITNNAPSQFGPGSHEVIFTALDAYGNSDTCSAVVTVELKDTTPPVINCPQGITVMAFDKDGVSAGNAQIQAFLNAATASDNIDGDVQVTNNAPGTFPLGSTTVTFTAVDSLSNSANCQAVVLVEDQTPPVVTCPSDITVETESASGVPATDAKIKAFLDAFTASDVIDGSAVTLTNTAPTQFAVGDTVVTFAAIDKSGNSQSCTAKVTVKQVAPAYGGLYNFFSGGYNAYTGWNGLSTSYYQPSANLYQPYNDQLYNFQQSWDLKPNYSQQWYTPVTSNIWNQTSLFNGYQPWFTWF